ncbi:MAG: sugar ABC transporter substrate-binding protein [Lachnospiraceae bacterium]|nr:sugar ABC transporter substrate-binding protein [Lachnospiraceae bacterium]
MMMNKTVKRVLAGMICAVSGMSLLTGCGSSEVSAATTGKTYKMAYVVSTRDEYLGLLEDAVKKAADEKNVAIDVFYAGTDSLKMIDCVEAAKNKGNDAVLINLNAAEEAQACIEAAGDMKVVFVNRVPSDYSVLSENAAAVASDENTSGKYQGEYLAEYFKKEGKTDVSYLLLRGTDGLVHTTLRTEGALNAMKAAGLNLTEAAVIDADYDRNTAKNEMDNILPNVSFDCIISNNDAMAIGAIMALKDAGIDPAGVPIVGIDATADGRAAIEAGEMNMTVFQSPDGQAYGSVAAALNMLEGKPLAEGTECETAQDSPYVLYYPFVPVTK